MFGIKWNAQYTVIKKFNKNIFDFFKSDKILEWSEKIKRNRCQIPFRNSFAWHFKIFLMVSYICIDHLCVWLINDNLTSILLFEPFYNIIFKTFFFKFSFEVGTENHLHLYYLTIICFVFSCNSIYLVVIIKNKYFWLIYNLI